ncbi:MAG: hypothetical protein P9L92_00720 [Candidatus Electryonea clarkiae]|nr:hypothetical protein [Candidatus Electryonea clarkiae]MDP8287101.1 hypothetical protein [Candidatus Electryonea clarkiae]
MVKFSMTFRLLIVSILTSCLFSGCGSDSTNEPIDVIYTGNLMGTIAPCSCPNRKAGGLPRRATIFDSLESNPAYRVILDAGNFASIRPDIGPKKTEVLLAGMMKLGLDAIVPGFRDLNNGIEYLLEIEKKHQIPFVSANLMIKETEEIPFPGSRIISLGAKLFKQGKQIAVIGITNGSPNRRQHSKSGVKFSNPVDAINKELERIPENVQMIVLLTDAPRDNIEKWLEKIGNDRINLIFCSNNRTFKKEEGDISGIPFYVGSRQGKRLDHLIVGPSEGEELNVEKGSTFLGKKIASNKLMMSYIKELQVELEMNDNQVGDFESQ